VHTDPASYDLVASEYDHSSDARMVEARARQAMFRGDVVDDSEPSQQNKMVRR
jgi:hypothetical protein